MKDSEKKLTLTSFDDIFKNDETRQEESTEQVQLIWVDLIDDFPNYPFKILDDEKMQDTIKSIKQNGVLVPVIIRPKQDGRYEIVSGHRRYYVCIAQR